MKQEAFKEYTKGVTDLFSVTEKELFSKTKRRKVVDARHLLYFLCFNRPMQVRYIQQYMKHEGYNIGHSSIIYGIEQVSQKMKEDRDYKKIMERIS